MFCKVSCKKTSPISRNIQMFGLYNNASGMIKVMPSLWLKIYAFNACLLLLKDQFTYIILITKSSKCNAIIEQSCWSNHTPYSCKIIRAPGNFATDRNLVIMPYQIQQPPHINVSGHTAASFDDFTIISSSPYTSDLMIHESLLISNL